jgi:hypothetical protein
VVAPLRGPLARLLDLGAVLEEVLDRGLRRDEVIPDLQNIARLDLTEIADGIAPDVIRVFLDRAEVVGRVGPGLLQRLLPEVPAFASDDLVAELSARPDHDLLVGRERRAFAHGEL